MIKQEISNKFLKIFLPFVAVCVIFSCTFHTQKTYTKSEVKQCSKDKDLTCDFNEKLITGIVKQYNQDKTLIMERTFKNGKLDGPSKTYYENGQIEKESSFENGKQDGPFKIYYENGQIQGEGSFKNGQPHGVTKTYYENGQIQVEGSFKNGQPHGVTKTYYENGKLKREYSYKNGKTDGPAKTYYENGQIEEEGFFKNGQAHGVFKKYYENGKLQGEYSYKNGKKEHPEHIHNFAKRYRGRGASYEEAALVAYCIEEKRGVHEVTAINQLYQYGDFTGAENLVKLTGCDFQVVVHRINNLKYNK